MQLSFFIFILCKRAKSIRHISSRNTLVHRGRLSGGFDDKSRRAFAVFPGPLEGRKIWRPQLVVAPFHCCQFRIRDISLGRGQRGRGEPYMSSHVPRRWSSRAGKTHEKRPGLRWATTRGNRDGDSTSPRRPLFLSRAMHFHILAFIGLLRPARYMNIITDIFYGIAGWRRDGSIGRAQREARALHKVPAQERQWVSSLSWLVLRIARARHATPRHVVDLHARTCPVARTVQERRVKLDCVYCRLRNLVEAALRSRIIAWTSRGLIVIVRNEFRNCYASAGPAKLRARVEISIFIYEPREYWLTMI